MLKIDLANREGERPVDSCYYLRVNADNEDVMLAIAMSALGAIPVIGEKE